MIFNIFYAFKSPLNKSIQTVTEHVDSIEDSALVGTITMKILPKHLINDGYTPFGYTALGYTPDR